MNTNSDLEVWRVAWKAPAAEEPARLFNIRREGLRQEHKLRIMHIMELGLAVILIVFAGLFLQHNFSAEMLIWAIVVWTTTLAATAFSVWNWRLLWRTTSQSIAEYITIYQRRSLAMLRAAHFGLWLLLIEILIVVPWFTWDLNRGTMSIPRFWLGMGLLLLIATGLLVMLLRFRKNALLELAQVRQFQESFIDQT